jgi:hypothetical protein
MEIAALSGLVALGVAVSQLASASPKKKPQSRTEGFHTIGVGILPQSEPPSDPAIPVPSEYYTMGVQQYLTQDEANQVRDINNRINSMAATGAPATGAPATGAPQGIQAMKAQIQTILERAATRKSKAGGTSAERAAANMAKAGTELDMMYKTPGGQSYLSEPNAGPMYGTPLQYGTSVPAGRIPSQRSGQGPQPEPIDSATPQIALMSNGVETTSAWVRGDSVVSSLSGQTIKANDFKHNNMQPFFGGSVKQNMSSSANTSRLDMFTGAGSTQITKQEISPMFDYNQPFGQPFGNEPTADFVRSRIVDPSRRNNEKPFEPTRVGPAVGEKFGLTGKGGFQQLEVNEIMKRAMPTTDKLRVADKPKLSYNNQVIPGVHFVTAAALDSGEVRKYRPDTFFLNQTGERNGVATSEVTKEAVRPTQILKHTTRTDTTDELLGTPASQEAFKSYVAGDYRTPMSQQFGGAGYRNNDGSAYGGGARDDYGASSIEIRPNERLGTQDRTMGLNLAPADTGLVAVHYNDDARPTRRSETVGNIRQTGTPVGYANGAPAITTWDPSDVARTTVKETTIDWDYRGISGPGSGPERLKVYDPNDIAKPTQKSQLSQDSRIAGPAISVNKDFTSHESAFNMRKNDSKTIISRGRKPIAGNGNVAVFKGEIHQKSKRLTADDINDRSMAVNRVMGMTPGTADLGRVQYRLPLKLDISTERNMPAIVDAVENNPLNQSLRKNAIHDSMVYDQLMAGRR